MLAQVPVGHGSVDVLLPLKSPAPWLGETLRGLAEQDFANWNLICTIPDDSFELGHQVLESFPNASLVPVASSLNFPAVLNIGIRSGDSEYIARLDQDDVPLPNRLSQQVSFLETHPEFGMVATPVLVIDEFGDFVRSAFHIQTADVKKRLLIKNSIIHPSVMMRRVVLESVGGYCEEATCGEDYELWLRLAQTTGIAYLDEPLLKYRRHSAQMSATGAMDARGRSVVRHSRVRLARNGLTNRAMVEILHLLWSAPQVWRSWRRRSAT